MADKRIAAQVDVSVTGTEKVDALAKKIDALDDTKIGISADTSDADRDVAKLIERVKKLSTEDAMVVLAVDAGQAQAELNELLLDLRQFNGSDAEAQVKIDRINETRDDLDQLTEEIKRLDGTTAEVDIDTSKATKGLDDLGRSAESSKSVTANLVGNASQDLAELGGVAGTAGVAIGQMGEYMADAASSGEGFGSILKNFGTQALPIAAISVGIGLVGAAFQKSKERAKEMAESVKLTTEALLDQLGVIDQIEGRFDAPASAGEAFTDRLLGDETKRGKALEFLEAFGGTVEDLPRLLAALDAKDAGFIEKLLTGKGVDPAAARQLAEMVTGLADVGDRVVLDTPALQKYGTELVGVTNAIAGLGAEDAAEETLRGIATGSEEGRARVAALREEMEGATDVQILDAYIQQWGSLTAETERQEEAVKRWSTAITDAVVEAKEKMEEQKQAALEASLAWDAAATMADSYAAALDEINGASDVNFAQQAFKTVESFDTLKGALVDLKKAGKDWKNTDLVPDSVEEFRGVSDEVKGVTDAIGGMRDSIQTELGNVLSTEGIDAYSEKFDFFANEVLAQFPQMFMDMGLSQEEAAAKTQELMTELNLLPEDKEIQLTLTGIEQAKSALDTFSGFISTLDMDKQVAINTAIAEGDIPAAIAILNDELIARGYDPISINAEVDTLAAQADTDKFISNNSGKTINIKVQPIFGALPPNPYLKPTATATATSTMADEEMVGVETFAAENVAGTSAWGMAIPVMAGQPIVNNTIVHIPTADPSAMVRALQRWTRSNGSLPVNRGRG